MPTQRIPRSPGRKPYIPNRKNQLEEFYGNKPALATFRPQTPNARAWNLKRYGVVELQVGFPDKIRGLEHLRRSEDRMRGKRTPLAYTLSHRAALDVIYLALAAVFCHLC